MHFLSKYTLVCFFSATPILHAYLIDASCSGQDGDLLREASQQAFDMAEGARNALQANPRDPNVNRLLELLFGAQGQNGDTVDAQKLVTAFNGVVNMRTEVTQIASGTADITVLDNVIVYCDLKRVQKRMDGSYIDTSTTQLVTSADKKGHDLDQCGFKDLAFTWTPTIDMRETAWDANGKVTDFVYQYYPGQVTVCPWFLEWSRSKRFKTWRDLGGKAWLAKLAIPFGTLGRPYAPVDALNLLDKIMLHEFTHTYAAGILDDIRLDNGDIAYGWKQAVSLAKESSNDNESIRGKSAYRNSDSLALFASGVRLLGESPKVFISTSGRLSSDNPRPAKRSRQIGLQYSQTPAAFERFITMIKEERAKPTLA